ncbi:Tripartite-type tricarboxylate transporter, receptor component TctC [Variovorax sp. YR266]|uniref:Bug family tripartite tricarboxylate transporter substrate binding protein n=1 Tax=Variovorax sp. YR266 TaxID=1884386 RepID=UPI000895D12F|nr:tripartite tricarboxylate transporter substrate binding protein [Variovorax sp. YR266]SDY34711.1 Tripartite-type tricarboxylate transporter, receptor component TctC [Variovorax sp. YR266]
MSDPHGLLARVLALLGNHDRSHPPTTAGVQLKPWPPFFLPPAPQSTRNLGHDMRKPSFPHINRRAAAIFMTLAGIGGAPLAQPLADYPSKSITWVVGWPPGGSADTATRLVARKLEAMLGQPIVVDNRPGASGTIGLQAGAKAAPDGYTLITVPGPVVTNRPVPQLGKELVGVAMMGKGPAVLIGTKVESLPGNVRELIDAAKANPQKYSYVSSGNGTAQHLAGELFNQMAGTTITHIPYKGGTQAVTDVIGGQVSLGVLGITSALPHIMSGKLKAYAVTTAARSRNLPDVPTMAEAGLPGFEATQWFVVAAPTGVSADRIQKINEAIAAILKQPDVIDGFSKVGIEPEPATPQQTTGFVIKDQQRWKNLAQRTHLQLD